MRFDKQFYQKHFFQLERYRVSADKVAPDEPEFNEAVLKITVPAENAAGRVEKKFLAEKQPRGGRFVALTATSSGEGTVDALDRALRRLLVPIYPFLKHVRLMRYGVQNTTSSTSSEVEVFILASNKDGKLYFSEVSSVSVIEASFFALANIYNRYYRDYYEQSRGGGGGKD
jgi:2-isopropylmalate synthase